MRITVKENNRDRILQVVCNCCRRPLPVENGIVLEDYIHVDKAWGYFSECDRCCSGVSEVDLNLSNT